MVEIAADWQTWFFFGVVGIIVVYLIFSFIRLSAGAKKERKKTENGWEKLEMMSINDYRVTVIDTACREKSDGYELPETKKEFHVLFLTDDGEEIELEVDENLYLSLSKGDSGMLAVLNGSFYGFDRD